MTATLPLRQFDFSTASTLVDAIAVELESGRSMRPLFNDLLHALHCSKNVHGAYSYAKTDDDLEVSRLICRVLALLLRSNTAVFNADIATILSGVLSHGRWRDATVEYESRFNLVCSVIFVVEHMTPLTDELFNIFRSIGNALTHEAWPFPEHGTLTTSDLCDGEPATIQCLCDAAFGAAWWQIVGPDVERLRVTDTLLSMRPPLLHSVPPSAALELPVLNRGQSL
jgi:hypothetical protein